MVRAGLRRSGLGWALGPKYSDPVLARVSTGTGLGWIPNFLWNEKLRLEPLEEPIKHILPPWLRPLKLCQV
ncbi:unnamed protein product [Cuscuta epithymum]|uniref:Uncharacterized protein n=1 Tax=Cuscuta epithymum TaxID=186058 RepID=A0AAV0CV23_9ASTE|nr:unnamed protein product [Cuscuta epithymum]